MKSKKYLLAGIASSSALPPLPQGEEIYGILPEVEIPSVIPTWAWGILAFFVFTAIVVYRFLNKQNKPVEQVEAIPQKPKEDPKKVALKKIDELVNSKKYKEGMYKDVCVVIPQILKTFSHDLYNIGIGYGATGDEFLKSLGEYCVKSSIENDIQHIINNCDNILYIGRETSKVEVADIIDTLKKIVNAEWQDNKG